MKADAQTLIPIGFISFIVYRRVRGSIGFQPFRPKRLVVRMAFVGIIGLIFIGLSVFQPLVLAAAAAGVVAGGILAFYAVRHLAQEWRGDKLFIRTHIVIESTVVALFLGRLFYRIIFGSSTGAVPPSGAGFPAIKFDPFTVGFYFVIVGYYFGYFGWLFLNREELLAGSGKGQAASES